MVVVGFTCLALSGCQLDGVDIAKNKVLDGSRQGWLAAGLGKKLIPGW